MRKIAIVHGPNLNLLGRREPEIYGTRSFEDYLKILRAQFPQLELSFFQSNHEGQLIDYLQTVECDALIINLAAYSHTSIALADTLRFVGKPYVEVHISNIYEREPYRRHSFTAEYALSSVVGKGLEGYEEAIGLLVAGG